MITTQQKVTAAKTVSAPAAVATGDRYVLAWLDADGTIWWTTLGLNKNKDGYDTDTKLASTGFSTQNAPALTNLGGTVWMAWMQDPAQTASVPPPWPDPPSDQYRKPPVILVSSLDRSGWSQPQPVWDSAPSGNLQPWQQYQDWQQGVASSGAISAPALATMPSGELVLVWCELAVNGSDAPVVSTPEGPTPAGPFESQIFFSTWSKSKGWSPRSAVPDALTDAPPALAAFNGVVSMAFKGQSDNDIWFCHYDTKGWSKPAKLPVFQTSAGPALGVGDTGMLHLVWKGASDGNIFAASRAPGKGWSSQTKIPVVATSRSPALASQLSASTDLLLAWAGASTAGAGASDLYIAPLDALEFKQSQTYVFTIGNVKVVTQRSSDAGESDTDFLNLTVAVGSKPVLFSTVPLGDHYYGDDFDANVRIAIEVADDERVIMAYIIANDSLSPADVTNYLTGAGKSLASTALAAYTGSAEASALALKGGINVNVPTSGSALTALGAWLSGVVPGALAPNGAWSASCDGPVAAGVHAFTGAKLRQGGNLATDHCVGIDSAEGCGNNSLYDVGWSVSVQG
jgi:hypothetical protein